jgi:PhnB protein
LVEQLIRNQQVIGSSPIAGSTRHPIDSRIRRGHNFRMQINPYLTFPGTCREAFSFYAQCFGGTIDAIFTFGETPAAADAPAGWNDKIMHATLTFEGRQVMGSDAPPNQYQTPIGISMSCHPATVEEAERVFAELAKGGTVTLPIQETFWAQRFGMVVDRFGIPWMVNCDAAPAAA